MTIHAAIRAARAHREEIIFGSLTGLLSSGESPAPVALPRVADSNEPQVASHFGQTIPQDTPALLHLLDQLEAGVDENAEFDYAIGRLLHSLGSSFRRHGFVTSHYAPLSTAIGRSIDRHLGPLVDSENPTDSSITPKALRALKEAADLACSILAHGCEEATVEEADAVARGAIVNPTTVRAKVVDVERRNRDNVVVRLHMDPPLMYAVGEPLMIRTPYTPLMWRPVYSALPSNPDGLLELHFSNDAWEFARLSAGPNGIGTAGTQRFISSIIDQVAVGDEWVLSPHPNGVGGAPLGVRLEDPNFELTQDQDVIIIAEGSGLAPARAAVLQQVFGGAIGGTPQSSEADARLSGTSAEGPAAGTEAPAENAEGAEGSAENTESELSASSAPLPLAKKRPRYVHLVWGVHNPGQLYELQGLLGLARAFDWLRFSPVVEQCEIPEGTNPSADSDLPDTPCGTHSRNSLLTVGNAVDVALASSSFLQNKTFIIAAPTATIAQAAAELTENHEVPAQQIFEIPTDLDLFEL